MTLPSTFLNKCFKCHFYSSRRTSVPSYLKSMHKCTSYGPDKSRCKHACITHINQTEVVAAMFRSLQAGSTKTSICVFPLWKKNYKWHKPFPYVSVFFFFYIFPFNRFVSRSFWHVHAISISTSFSYDILCQTFISALL